MLSKIKLRFEQEKPDKTFRRIDDNHKLDIYLGYSEDNCATMVITAKGKIRHVESSKAIDIKLFKKNNKEYSLSFALLNKESEIIFYRFCEDIIESSRYIESNDEVSFILSRWNKWKLMFKKASNRLLNENEIQGLIGELVFIRDYLAPEIGYNEAIRSWMGPNKSHKDFEFEDIWYEVKSIKQGATTVKISSIEQLESNLEGYLEVITFKKSNASVRNAISLNIIIDNIKSKINNFNTCLLFKDKLLEIGYLYDDDYNEVYYKLIKKVRYSVEEEFPRIRNRDLRNGIVKVSYDILLKDIERFIEGDE
ncbi:PD-(D/E)XK motif protein [Clostridium tarantellae]|uniref:PD-(D/E)XK motif protein n=1 Tax=Clostridium tarantellae TaxID=39493 RepID=A0A6I1MKK8_9CLOT|nr:PD-(D/E)XK motif protein [Clostridium tarantellae]MPQ44066.1 PD-(D/E)XK motif protein [Clostridium tarantellae]